MNASIKLNSLLLSQSRSAVKSKDYIVLFCTNCHMPEILSIVDAVIARNGIMFTALMFHKQLLITLVSNGHVQHADLPLLLHCMKCMSQSTCSLYSCELSFASSVVTITFGSYKIMNYS